MGKNLGVVAKGPSAEEGTMSTVYPAEEADKFYSLGVAAARACSSPIIELSPETVTNALASYLPPIQVNLGKKAVV